jgi:hypothetical protein
MLNAVAARSLLSSVTAPVSNDEKTTELPEQGLDLTSSSIITIPAYSQLLEKIAMDLVSAVASAGDVLSLGNASDEERCDPFAAPGQHVVFIDRSTQRVILHSDKAVQKGRRSGDKNGFVELRALSLDPSSGLDRRHILASYLPPNVVEAFDDLMKQVYEVMASSDEELLQLCIYMSKGWVFAHAQEQQELYIYFEANKFVTVSDVQHAADRVRTELFKDPIA